ncbi:MAG: hypothetical protein ACE5E5_06695 [Phycisphaerae bacterium]
MKRHPRIRKWLLVLTMGSMLPAFLLRCDKAALNFQRGLLQGLGEDVGDFILQQDLFATNGEI